MWGGGERLGRPTAGVPTPLPHARASGAERRSAKPALAARRTGGGARRGLCPTGGDRAGRSGAAASRLLPPRPADALEIAAMELREKRIPFIIRRYMPGGTYEDWKLEELIIPDR